MFRKYSYLGHWRPDRKIQVQEMRLCWSFGGWGWCGRYSKEKIHLFGIMVSLLLGLLLGYRLVTRCSSPSGRWVV